MIDLDQNRKLSRRIPYIRALLLFTASRLVMLVAMAFADKFLASEPNAATWEATSRWFRFLLRYDSGWYLHIAMHGYSYDGNDLVKQTVVFYPLYPALIKGLTFVGLSHASGAVLISNVAIIISILVFAKFVTELHDQETAVLSVAFLSFFPASMFFSAAYTESLAFLFIICFFLFLRRRQFLVAAAFAGLCFATRPVGLILIPPLVWELVRHYWRGDRGRLFFEGLLCLAIASSGLWLYMVYLWITFRAPFAFITDLAAWRDGSSFGSPLLLKPFIKAATDLRYQIQHGIADPNSLSAILFIIFVALLIIFRKQLSPAFLLFSAGALVLPYFSRSGSVGFVSFSRYTMLAFPVFIVVAAFCRRRVCVALAIVGVSGALLFWYMALFAKWYWVG